MHEIFSATDNEELSGEDPLEVVVGCAKHLSDNTKPPTGAVQTYDNMIWSPNYNVVTATLEGYVKRNVQADNKKNGMLIAPNNYIFNLRF